MQTRTYSSQVNGKPAVIENPLLPEHVEVGRLLWYDGFTSMFEWSCPAVITRIDPEKKTFQVCSLDDMIEQDQKYGFSTDDDGCGSRMSMRLVEAAIVKEYLAEREKIFQQSVERARESLKSEEQKYAHFKDILATLKI